MYLVKKVFENQPEFLKSADIQAYSCTVSDADVKADADGKKYVLGGNLLDADGKVVEITRSGSSGSYTYALSADPVGLLFATTDVTHGPQPGALMIDGSVNTERLPGEYVAEALPQIIPKLPHIKFFVDGQLQIVTV